MSERRGSALFALVHRATRGLTLQGKIRLLPKVAAGAMALGLALTVAFGVVTRRSASRIRDGYYPSVQASRELREGLARIQRRLQDGVSARDAEPLDEARAIKDSLLRVLEEARRNPVVDQRELATPGREIGAYFALARGVSERLIAGEVGDSVFAALGSMTHAYNALSGRLERNIAADQARIASAFDRADALERAQTIAVALIAVASIAVLGLLSSTQRNATAARQLAATAMEMAIRAESLQRSLSRFRTSHAGEPHRHGGAGATTPASANAPGVEPTRRTASAPTRRAATAPPVGAVRVTAP